MARAGLRFRSLRSGERAIGGKSGSFARAGGKAKVYSLDAVANLDSDGYFPAPFASTRAKDIGKRAVLSQRRRRVPGRDSDAAKVVPVLSLKTLLRCEISLVTA
jgi:hypothetical protein